MVSFLLEKELSVKSTFTFKKKKVLLSNWLEKWKKEMTEFLKNYFLEVIWCFHEIFIFSEELKSA